MSTPATSSTKSPVVALTGTTETIRGIPRVRVNLAYTKAIEAAGLIPLVVPPLDDPASARAILSAVDGLVLTGGEDIAPERYDEHPHETVTDVNAPRDATEIALLLEAKRRHLPTLAICRGVQLLNVALGGSLVQDIASAQPRALIHNPGGARDDRSHSVAIIAESRLARAIGAERIEVNSSHHQAVGRVASGLRVVARAPDGVIEGAEVDDQSWWAVGVQWHPEELIDSPDEWDRALFAAFARVVRGEAP